MEIDSPVDAPAANKQPATAAENIKSLSAISKEIPQLLQSAGSALSLLTNTAHPVGLATGAEIPQQSDSLDVRKAAFLSHVRKYYETLRKVQQGLNEQATALEDAGIIPAEAPKPDADGITNGGLGNMDVAWLNSRSRDVGAEKEKETVREAKEWLDSMREARDVIMEDT